MKKIFTLLSGFLLFAAFTSKGQDTLLYEGFQFVMTSYLTHVTSPPPGNTVDSLWYDYDADQLADGSGSSKPREMDFWQIRALADTNLYDMHGDTNIVMAASSWFGSPGQADNWLITKNIQLGAHDTLFWKSAPSELPRYLDGYEVKISTTTNDDISFHTVLFTAAEMTAVSAVPHDSAIFANHTFSSPGIVHGLDGHYIQSGVTATSPYTGMLRPFSVPLDAYANQNVFIAFHHNSYDDNLITFDDILIRGTPKNPVAGISENKAAIALNIFPNPSNDNAQLNFELASETAVIISVSDITGKSVYSENKGTLTQGRHFAMINSASLSKGFYTVAVQTNNGRSTAKLIVE